MRGALRGAGGHGDVLRGGGGGAVPGRRGRRGRGGGGGAGSGGDARGPGDPQEGGGEEVAGRGGLVGGRGELAAVSGLLQGPSGCVAGRWPCAGRCPREKPRREPPPSPCAAPGSSSPWDTTPQVGGPRGGRPRCEPHGATVLVGVRLSGVVCEFGSVSMCNGRQLRAGWCLQVGDYQRRKTACQ